MTYLRFESPTPNSRGHRTGIFGLANGLAHSGVLSPADHHWWRSANDWFNQSCPNPADTHPELLDQAVSCWFKTAAVEYVERARLYLELLTRYDIACVETQSDIPGPILYEDSVQIVVRYGARSASSAAGVAPNAQDAPR